MITRKLELRVSLTVIFLFGLLPYQVKSAEENRTLEKAFQVDVKPFLKQFCERCHNPEKLTSGIRVDHLDSSLDDRHLKLWTGILGEIKSDAMPPEGEPQPTKEQRKKIVEWIGQAVDIGRSRPAPKNGSIRRLTVAQYRNTLRELFLLEDDLTDILPPDAVSKDGFLNNQATLQLSPLLLETYLEIAEKALKRTIIDPSRKPIIQSFRVDLGAGVNSKPISDRLILGAGSLLLKNSDFNVTELQPKKPFEYSPFSMRTKYRFIEGYQGNDTVRGWREYDSIYHAVFACMRGTDGYPKGLAYSTVPQGLLLRPAIPSSEIFGVESTYGPRANFKIALRELPDEGRFRVIVKAAKYDDGLLLDSTVKPQPENANGSVVCPEPTKKQSIQIPKAGIYQIDIVHDDSEAPSKTSVPPAKKLNKKQLDKLNEVNLILGDREFSGAYRPAFLAVRLSAGEMKLQLQTHNSAHVEKIVITPLDESSSIAQQFINFEKRTPRLGVHMGFRRDCGSTLAPVGSPQTVLNNEEKLFVFEGAIRNFPNPEVEKDNVNYLAGVREIGVRSEYTDGRDMPRLLIRSVDFEGPFFDTWPPQSHRNIFGSVEEKNATLADARKMIREFATKAYRRPISVDEESNLLKVFESSRNSGSNFRDSVKDVLQVVITSPQFLFLIENSQSPKAEPLDEFELASKLSYFLSNGPPDKTTMSFANSSSLRKNLDVEISRLIDDPKFGLFANEFATQWLSLDKFQVLEPDRKQFPKLTRDIRGELKQEPIQYLQYLVRQNLPVKNLIESDFVLANEVTVGYYDLNVKLDIGFQFIPVRPQRPELGGLLSQAAILAGLSDGRESNPVKRGAWLARRIVAEPPDDPPPNVPTLKEGTKKVSLRERLEQHRNQKGCAQCHSKIDPWGVPFEEFDAGGRLKNTKIDAQSTLPDKTEVRGFNDLKRYLANDRIDQVAFSMLKHLATYATGRSLTYQELEYLRTNGKQLKADGYRMREMIRFVVNSPIFLEK